MAAESGGTIVAPNVRDWSEATETFRAWLSAKMPQAKDLKLANFTYPRGAGMSHETVLFDIEWREDGKDHTRGLVARLKPTDQTVYQLDRFEKQYELMRSMHAYGKVRVAEPLWLEHDASLLGSPFFVMEKKIGRVPVSQPQYTKVGWVVDSTPQQRRTMWEDGVRQLAMIATFPTANAQFLDPDGKFPDGFEQEWEDWRNYTTWVKAGRSDFDYLDEIWAQLEKTRPSARHPGIVWGDSRIGNMMFGADYKVAAVMDWEAPSLGGALHDLAWWVVIENMQTAGQGVARLDGMGDREETLALWRETCGIPTTDILWYEQFAAYKLSCLAIRMIDLRGADSIPGTQSDYRNNPPMRFLAETLGKDFSKS